MTKIYINGKIVSEASATISVFDRSYLYGEGAFETMRAYKGRPAFCDMHYHRLKNNCEKLKIELPLDEYAFEHAVVKTINVNKLKDAYVRVTVSPVGMSMGISRPPKLSTNLVIIARPFKGRPESTYADGATLVMVESVYADDPEMAEIKSTNYLTKMLARMEVSEKKADEGIFVNRKGLILEATAANLFIVKNECLITPPLVDGCLPGITRWVVMGLAENLHVPVEEASLRPQDLKDADEIFITGSTSEVLPVREVRGITRKKETPGAITMRLMRAYKELVSAGE
jgi:branched-chain amino acid aminotransferase